MRLLRQKMLPSLRRMKNALLVGVRRRRRRRPGPRRLCSLFRNKTSSVIIINAPKAKEMETMMVVVG